MHRFRSWTLDPPEWRTQRNRILAAEGGDGSTLSFDFTGGTLDSRFVFERSTNATFINSQGYVEWANANMFRDTEFSLPFTSPNPFIFFQLGTGGSATRVNDTVVIDTPGTASQPFIYQIAQNQIGGVAFTASVEVVSVTGTLSVGNLLGPTSLIGSPLYFKNGSSSSIPQGEAVAPGVYYVQYICSNAGTNQVRFGCAAAAPAAAVNVVITKPQLQPGRITDRQYLRNTSTSSGFFNIPRFGYNYDTLERQGLFIEPACSNLALSLDPAISTTYWGRNNIIGSGTAGALALGQTGPDNYANSAARITTATTGLPINQFVGAATSAAGNTRTFSVWVRGVGSQTTASISIISNAAPGTPAGINAYIVGPGSFTTPVSGSTLFGVVTGLSTTKWTRIGISRTDTIGSFDSYRIYVGDATSATNISSGVSVDIYVPQLESGAGMSSTIPTGASTVNRSYDACYVPTTNFTTNTTNWSILAEWEDARIDDATQIQKWVLTTADAANNGTGLFYSDSGAFPLGGGVSNSGDATSATTVAISAINKAAFSFVRTPTPAVRMSLNGEDIVTGTQGQPAIPDKLNIGSRAYSSAGRFLGGYIRKIKYWPSLLSDNELKTLSSINYLSPSFDVDFTGMSSLTDLTSRGFTFSRTTNATFINSQGFVQYADANMVVNSTMLVVTPYTQNITGTGAITINGDNTVRFNGLGGRATWFQTINVSQGLPISYSVEVTSFTNNTLRTTDMFAVTPAHITGAQYRYTDTNGVTSTIGAFDSLPVAGSDGRGLYTVYGTTAGATFTILMGSDCNGVGRLGDVTMARPQVRYDQIVPRRSYLPNSSTAFGNFNTPCFDYDPSTLQPRGLLIEGISNNICEQGQFCWGTGATNTWSRLTGININSVNGTAGANAVARINGPDNGTLTGTSIHKDAGALNQFSRSSIPIVVVPSTTYTFSAYVRAPSGGNPYMRLAAFNGSSTWLNTTGFTSSSGITITNTVGNGTRFNGVPSDRWIRVWVTFTTQAGQTSGTIAFYPDTDTANAATMYVWGAQVELGSGPSSVIPTGASTGNKQADILEMTGASFSSIWPLNRRSFSLYCEASLIKAPPASTLFMWLTRASGGSLHRTVVATSGLATYFPGGSIPQLTSAVTPARDVIFKTAIGSVQNDHGFGINNTLIVSTDTNTLSTASDSFYFNPNSDQFMHLRNLKLWLYRLPNQTLKIMTV